MSPFGGDLPVYEFYTRQDGARLDLHPWFYLSGREYLGFTRALPPRTGRGPAHVHPGVEQRSVVLDGGTARYRLGGRTGLLAAGDELVVPPGRPHVDPFNASSQPVTVRAVFSPGPVSLLAYGRTLGQALRDGAVNAQQELPLAHLLLMLAQPDSAILAAGLPPTLQRHLLRLLAPVLRKRGYRPAAGFRERAGTPQMPRSGTREPGAES
jgi:mannose-6-phosphate isomerase-like protein (cupin superfamily)